jgi:hypothetical protein
MMLELARGQQNSPPHCLGGWFGDFGWSIQLDRDSCFGQLADVDVSHTQKCDFSLIRRLPAAAEVLLVCALVLCDAYRVRNQSHRSLDDKSLNIYTDGHPVLGRLACLRHSASDRKSKVVYLGRVHEMLRLHGDGRVPRSHNIIPRDPSLQSIIATIHAMRWYHRSLKANNTNGPPSISGPRWLQKCPHPCCSAFINLSISSSLCCSPSWIPTHLLALRPPIQFLMIHGCSKLP